jgi:hypothetical protein
MYDSFRTKVIEIFYLKNFNIEKPQRHNPEAIGLRCTNNERKHADFYDDYDQL